MMLFSRSKSPEPTPQQRSRPLSPAFNRPASPCSDAPSSPVVETFSVQRPDDSVVNQYVVLSDLGSGAYGKVVRVQNREDGKEYACKIISKSRLRKQYRWRSSRPGSPVGSSSSSSSPQSLESASAPSSAAYLDEVKQEIAILKKVSKCHPNITSLVEVLDDSAEQNLYLVFDICEQGPIMQMHAEDPATPYAAEDARKLFRDVVLGLEFLHSQRIIHRDIKPENILITADGTAQISDFGISNMCETDLDDDIALRNASPAFMPPEAFTSGVYTVKGKSWDVWSLGVTLYCLLHGSAPFSELSLPALISDIQRTDPLYSSALSPECVDLLRRMLDKNPATRITVQAIKEHPWVTCQGAEPMLSTEDNCGVWEDLTQADIDNALQPATSFFARLLNKLREGRRSSARSLQSGRPTSPTSVPSRSPTREPLYAAAAAALQSTFARRNDPIPSSSASPPLTPASQHDSAWSVLTKKQ
ncbi:hypothetical protein RI367_003051 [Sorochytrium milnesiophthora]